MQKTYLEKRPAKFCLGNKGLNYDIPYRPSSATFNLICINQTTKGRDHSAVPAKSAYTNHSFGLLSSKDIYIYIYI